MRDLFDKYYEHPVDRIRELGSTSQFHRRDHFGEIQKNQTQLQEINENQEEQVFQDGIGSVPVRKSIKERLRNLFYQQYSFLYLLVGLFWIVMMILFFININQSHYKDGDYSINRSNINRQLSSANNTYINNIILNLKESQLRIIDDIREHLDNELYHLEYECYSDTFDDSDVESVFSNCLITLHLNIAKVKESNPFDEIRINCKGENKCIIHVESQYLVARQIDFSGYNLHVRAKSITASVFKYNSHFGSIFIENLYTEESSWLNTNRGDIVIETQQHVLLNTYTIDKLVCATAPLVFKVDSNQNYTQIMNLDEHFEQLGPVDCLDCNTNSQPINGDTVKLKKEIKHNHSNFSKQNNDKQKKIEGSNEEEGDDGENDGENDDSDTLRCTALRNVLLLNSASHYENFKEIQKLTVTSAEGNIFINVIDQSGFYGPPLFNSLYYHERMRISNSSEEFLNQQLEGKKPKDISKIIMNLFFDDRRGLFHDDNQMTITFNFEYRFLPPWWVSTLTFNTLNFEVVDHDLIFTPSKCPYYLSKQIQEQTFAKYSTGNYSNGNFTYGNFTYGKFDYGNYSHWYYSHYNSSLEYEELDSIAYQSVTAEIDSYGINDISIRFNGKVKTGDEIVYTAFIVFGIIIIILSAIGSIMMHIWFYRTIEMDRHYLKKKAFEMWIYITMNLFGKTDYHQIQEQQNFQELYQQGGYQEQMQYGMNNIYQSQTIKEQQVQNYQLTQSEKRIQYFEQTILLFIRLFDNSILMNYNEVSKELQQYDIAPILINLLSQPINILLKNDISRYIPIQINYCILCIDPNLAQEVINLFTLISDYLMSNQELPSENKVFQFTQRIQQLINEKNPPFIHKVFNLQQLQRDYIIQNQQQFRYALLNQSIFFLKCYLQGYQGGLKYRIYISQNTFPIDPNTQDDMFNQFSQFYLKCKQNCPQIFEQIWNNDVQKVSLYQDTLQDNMKMYNVYTRITKELQNLQSNFAVSGFLQSIKIINYLFETILVSPYQANFINILFELWQYMSTIQIKNQYDVSQVQSFIQSEQVTSNQQLSLNQQQSTEKQTKSSFFQNLFSKSSQKQEQQVQVQTNLQNSLVKSNYYQSQISGYDLGIAQDPTQIGPKSIQIVQKYDYYPTFTNMINVFQCIVKSSKSTIECFCELIFAKIPKQESGQRINPVEYCDDLSFEKFKEYYAVYCYALNCNEEVLEPNQEFNKILEKYMYALDGNFIRAFSATGRYKVFIGLMEHLFYVINMAPKQNHDVLLDKQFSLNLVRYRHYLLKHSYKINKLHAYTIFENVAQYIFILFLLNLPFILCTPIIFAQSAYSHSYFQFQYAQKIFYQQNFDHFFTIFCSSGFPITVFVITFTFIFICAIDTLFYFAKPRLDKNNFYISYFKILFSEYQPVTRQNNNENNILNSPYVAEDLRFSSHGLNMSQQHLFSSQQQESNHQVRLQDMDGEKIPQDRYSNRTIGFYFSLAYQIIFQVLLWSLIGFNTFFFFLTLLILTISSFVYLEQGLLFAIFLLILIGVLFLRQRNLRQTHKNTKSQLKQSWERLLICNITQQYAVNIQLNSQLVENFLRDKNLDEKYYRRNKILASVKAQSYYDESCGAIYRYVVTEKTIISRDQFIYAIQYMIQRGVYLCLKLLKISTSDIFIELAQQAFIQFAVFLLCSLIVDYFNLCKNGIELLINAILTIVIAITIFHFLDKKHSYINAQTLDNSVNYVSRVQCKTGITIFTQNIEFKQF